MKSSKNRIIKVVPCEYTLSIRGRLGIRIFKAVTVPKPPWNHRTMKDFRSFTITPRHYANKFLILQCSICVIFKEENVWICYGLWL